MGIENLEERLENYGYEVYDSSLDPEVIRRKNLSNHIYQGFQKERT